MHIHLCVCAHIKLIPTETRIVVVIHSKENNKPSNTGHLCAIVLKNSEVRVASISGTLDHPLLPSSQHQSYLLFPDEEESIELSPQLREDFGPLTLVVPDAPWHQARRMARKWRSLRGLPRVRLPNGRPGQFGLRKTTIGPHALGTLEAVGRALGILECQWVEDEICALHRRVVHRGLYARGRAPADDELRTELDDLRRRQQRTSENR